MKARMNRRGFLQAAAGAGGSLLILRDSRSARSAPANEKANLAVVGLGNRGSWHARNVPRLGQNLVAVCDAKRDRMAEVSAGLRDVAQYQDFRKMLDEMSDRIDALIIATPDHTHAIIAAEAMKRGKHVFVEKPIAHDVAEARALRRIANERRVATQMGNQGIAGESFWRVLERIRKGDVGEIREAHVWFIFGGPGPLQRPTDEPPAPEGLDWNLWLGPAPLRPYHPRYIDGWGAWRDFSTGCLGGGGSHSIHMTFKALELGTLWEGGAEGGRAIRVETETPQRAVESLPAWQIARFEIPARKARGALLPPATIHWYNAPEPQLQKLGIWERLEKIAGRSLEWHEGWTPRSGTLLVGSKGVVQTNAHNSLCRLLPEGDFPEPGGPLHEGPVADRHLRDWLRAGQEGGEKPRSNFDHSGPAIELLLLGNIASRVGEPIEFDPVGMKIANHAEADAALRPKHREGWAL